MPVLVWDNCLLGVPKRLCPTPALPIPISPPRCGCRLPPSVILPASSLSLGGSRRSALETPDGRRPRKDKLFQLPPDVLPPLFDRLLPRSVEIGPFCLNCTLRSVRPTVPPSHFIVLGHSLTFRFILLHFDLTFYTKPDGYVSAACLPLPVLISPTAVVSLPPKSYRKDHVRLEIRGVAANPIFVPV